MMAEVRINRYLATCGLGSRRAVEELIREGRVRVDGRPVSDLSTRIDTTRQTVEVDGRPVAHEWRLVYLKMNKPRGYDVTRGGRHHHRRAYDLLPEGTHASVQSVGRLDRNSTGLLIFTNDGQLAHRLTHPRFGCRKTYDVLVEGEVSRESLSRLTDGVELDDGPARAEKVERLAWDEPARSCLRIVMIEGRNRIVRRMCEAIGHPVLELNRTAIGQVDLGNLKRGRVEPLSLRELNALKRAVGLTGGRGGKTN